jgi:hypothetical protein
MSVGEPGITMGWGQTSDGTSSSFSNHLNQNFNFLLANPGLTENLLYVYVVSITNEECSYYFGAQIKDSMLCVDGNYNQGFCWVMIIFRVAFLFSFFNSRVIAVVL